MAASKQKPGRDRFSTTEAAEGAGLSPRNVMYLCSESLIPVIEGGGGQGSHRQLDYDGLARVALIGAFYCAGIEIYLASRLVQEIGEEADFHDLSNLDSFLSGPHSGIVSMMHEHGLDPAHAFYLHQTLRRRSNSYRPSSGMAYDNLIEIFDRLAVFLNHLVADSGTDVLRPSNQPTALYKIDGWKKGMKNIQIEHAPSHRVRHLPSWWEAVRANSKGMTRVNVSLAIRDALDSIAASRGY